MSHLQYFNYRGFGERAKKDTNYSQAVRIDNRIEISGQGGWDPITEDIPTDRAAEIDATFDNVERALQTAGGTGFDQIYKLRVYVVGWTEEALGSVVGNIKRRFPAHQPLLTVVEVSGLYKTMTIEIEAEAHIDG